MTPEPSSFDWNAPLWTGGPPLEPRAGSPRRRKWILAVCIAMLLSWWVGTGNTSAQGSVGLYPVPVNGKYGYVDRDGARRQACPQGERAPRLLDLDLKPGGSGRLPPHLPPRDASALAQLRGKVIGNCDDGGVLGRDIAQLRMPHEGLCDLSTQPPPAVCLTLRPTGVSFRVKGSRDAPAHAISLLQPLHFT